MSDFDRALPPSDRQEQPDPMPRETALRKVRRLCREMGLRVPYDPELDEPPPAREPGSEG